MSLQTEGAKKRQTLRMKRAQYTGRWNWRKKPPNCEKCGDWGVIPSKDPSVLPHPKCDCGAKRP